MCTMLESTLLEGVGESVVEGGATLGTTRQHSATLLVPSFQPNFHYVGISERRFASQIGASADTN
jgi:hypothetical protein